MSAEPICGADIVIKALVDQGVDVVFGYPGGAVLPIYDFAVQAERAAPHPGAPGGRRGACRRRLCPLHRQGRRRAGDLRPRRDQRGDRPDRRADGFGADRLPHRAGADAPDRQRRVPGSRHDRHHPALHQAQLPGQGRRRSRARVLHEAFYVAKSGRPGPVVVDLPKDVLFALAAYTRPGRSSASTRATGRKPGPTRRGSPRRWTLIAAAKRPLFYGGGGLDQFRPRGLRPVYRVRAADRRAVHLDPDGARRTAGQRPAFPRHGRHARHVRGEHGDARLRPDDRGRLALRRPGDRPAQRLLAEFEEDPHRYRPVLDQQERAGRRAAARRLRRGARRRCWRNGARRRRASTAPRATPGGGRSRPGGRATACTTTSRATTSSSRNTRWSGSMR